MGLHALRHPLIAVLVVTPLGELFAALLVDESLKSPQLRENRVDCGGRLQLGTDFRPGRLRRAAPVYGGTAYYTGSQPWGLNAGKWSQVECPQ